MICEVMELCDIMYNVGRDNDKNNVRSTCQGGPEQHRRLISILLPHILCILVERAHFSHKKQWWEALQLAAG